MKAYVYVVMYDNGESYEDNVNHVHKIVSKKTNATLIVDEFNEQATVRKYELPFGAGFEIRERMYWEKWEIGRAGCVESYDPIYD